ncbi:carboxypeptidase-like regulatory domain-containing protein [Flavobacterium psychrophilum]|uniref:Carboxypeptidase-like regulatory domain-containing protein n=2 Tax=Flavobacterium psychrophilum TaxID=96345 RepID=A0A7U2NG37_FLAPS|nr:carboxypeptidase-like regulatory domain-containing protein [Flavobacterium psychrophilum]ELI6455132.1 carboxypeptidase-like regulatory domain-containing protein [Flavobacterium psychrophilum]ELM3644533.1 carboxypeptidase-like regulatory domain-containing protein [Flavobacterium psychrophilum]OAE92012.1 hypothetical protein SU65_09615 [Flavobacterium psychrophilum]QRE04546.1 carboxypeptidase-like regulatory domain-containing protein [Flavobacterium psychrophilum]SNA76036.1 putative outer mem
MKKTFTFLLFSIITFSYSQNISGIILDSISKKPLELASVTLNKTNRGVYSDAEGKFKISLTNENDYLLISYLGYTTKKVCASNFIKTKENNSIFYLSSTTERLNEVFVQNKKIEYGWEKTIKFYRGKTRQVGFQFGTENCTYIENSDYKKGKIKSVILSLNKMQDNFICEKCKMDYLASYNVKFYSYDSINHIPEKEIFSKDIIVYPENKSYSFVIDVDSLNISFPKNGVCIGVEIINTKYKNPKTTGAFIGPAIDFSESKNIRPIIAWTRSRTEGHKFMPNIDYERDTKKLNKPKIQIAMIVDLVIKPEK